MNQDQARRLLARFCRLGWRRGYLAATDGNLSLRLDPERVLITPAGRSKALVAAEDMVLADLSGAVLAGGRPSAELGLHLAAYQARPQAGAVVHAHPPLATALTVAGRELDPAALPEVLVGLGAVPVAPYATPGSPELAQIAGALLAEHDALLLDHHGTLTLGPDLETAWARTEKLESAAQVLLAAGQLGGARPLPPQEQERLRALGGRAQPQAAPLPLAQRVELIHLPVTSRFATEKRASDARGQAHLIWDDLPLRRVCLLTLEPGQGARGGHLHQGRGEGVYVAQGRVRIELACPASGERHDLELEPGHRLWIPPGVAHRFTALEPLIFVEVSDRPYAAADDRPYDF